MAKKTFKDSINPAMSFISQESIDRAEGEAPTTEETAKPRPAKAPEGYKLNPLYVETKSKRVQLVLQPSLYTKVKAAADAEGISFNEYCHRLLEEATREE